MNKFLFFAEIILLLILIYIVSIIPLSWFSIFISMCIGFTLASILYENIIELYVSKAKLLELKCEVKNLIDKME